MDPVGHQRRHVCSAGAAVREIHLFLQLGQGHAFPLSQVLVEAAERAQLDDGHDQLGAHIAVLVDELELVADLEIGVFGVIGRAGGGRFPARHDGLDHLLTQAAVTVPAKTETLHRREL